MEKKNVQVLFLQDREVISDYETIRKNKSEKAKTLYYHIYILYYHIFSGCSDFLKNT